MAEITWTLKTFNISDLTDFDKNPRFITDEDKAQLKKSLDKFGMIDKPIVNLDEHNTVIGGHQRLKVLREERVKSCECWVPDRMLDDDEVRELNIRLNLNQGQFDHEKLLAFFDRIDLGNWGFSDKELSEIFGDEKSDGDAPDAQMDRADELQEKWQVQKGDLWAIGTHKIICGDSTDPDTVARLMQGEQARIAWTDPPWNVAYGESLKEGQDNGVGWKKRTIANDNLGEKFGEFASNFCSTIYNALVPGGILYMAMSAQEWGLIMNTLEEIGFHWSSTIIWAKDSLVLSRKDYHTQYEPLWYGWRDDGPRVCSVIDRKQSDLWEIERPKNSPEHPTMKPVELVERSLRNSSHVGNLVFDPFLGSGTTVVAAERLHRKCYGLEMEPKYIAVVLERLSEMGLVPELLESAGDSIGVDIDSIEKIE